MSSLPHASLYEGLLQKVRDGDAAARNELLQISQTRLRSMVQRMMLRVPALRRWVESSDVLQNANIRLSRALTQMTFATPQDFFRIAAHNIRNEVYDLARHYYGRQGKDRNPQATQIQSLFSSDLNQHPDRSHEMDQLQEWSEFHAAVEKLPPIVRDVFDQHWYFDLSLPETAKHLGISLAMTKRCWAQGKIALMDKLGDDAFQ